MLRLLIQEGDHPAVERVLDKPQVIVGRSPEADLYLSDEAASRQHARLYQSGGHWWVENLKARNGTIFNGRGLAEPTILHAGDRIRIGNTDLQVIDAPGGAGPAAAVYAAAPDETSAVGVVKRKEPSAEMRQTARLAMLNEVHLALATTISQKDLLNLILERCFTVLRPEEGAILLRDEHGEWQAAAARRLPGAPRELFVSRQILKEAEEGRSALVLDASADERFAASQSLVISGVRSVVAAPLADAGGTLGVIALYSRVGVRQFSQDDLDVLVSLASAAALRVRNIALAEEAAARKVLERELSLASEIQRSMLPQRKPDRSEVELGAVLKPAQTVGGDLYDFVLDDGLLWFIVGDVSGKGMAAALYMAVAKTLFRAIVRADMPIADVVGRINRELSRDNEWNMFVTAVIGCLDLGTGTVQLSDAGHNAPLIVRRDGTAHEPSLRKGLVLGVIDRFEYSADTLQLAPGEALLIYTDGVTEALDAAGEQYQVHRLHATLAAAAGQSAQDTVDGVLADVDRFAVNRAQEDDITMLLVRYRGVPQP